MNIKLKKVSVLIKNYSNDEISNVKLFAILIVYSVFIVITTKACFEGR